MKYRVVWEPAAERDLTELWLRSRMRHTMSLSANNIDLELEKDPYSCSESRDAGRRVMFVWPLGASIAVDDKQQQVRVLSIWQI